MNEVIIQVCESVKYQFQCCESEPKAGPMVPSLFGRWVKERLAELGMSQRDFSGRVGISQSNLNKILNGSHENPPTPLGLDCAKWADVLGIPEAEQKRFHMMSAVAHIPWPVNVQFEQWVDEHLALKAEVLTMRDAYRARVAEVPPPSDGSPPGPTT